MMKVLLPVAAPGIVTTLIFIFINAWNESRSKAEKAIKKFLSEEDGK